MAGQRLFEAAPPPKKDPVDDFLDELDDFDDASTAFDSEEDEASRGASQMKALFFILLLAGHDAVRVTQEAGWSKSKWNELHAGCSWYGESCGEAETRWKVLEARKCRRREAQMTEASKLGWPAKQAGGFIVRAFMNETFIATLDESEKAAVKDGFEKLLVSMSESKDDAETMRDFLKKIKCKRSEFLRDPKKVLGEVAAMGQALSSGDPAVTKKAKLQLAAMPDTCGAVSAEEEAEGMLKLKDLQKESEQERGLALDQLEEAIDHVVEEEAESANSALQLLDTSALAVQNSTLPRGPLLLSIVTTVAMTSVMIIGSGPVGAVIFVAVSFWVISSILFCCVRDFTYEYAPGEPECMKEVFLAPFKAVKNAVKGAAKGAVRLGKGIYKYFRRGNASNSSALFETEAIADELPELAEPLADEVSRGV
eukprot:Skav217640  [mRNA]  locus=scaffold73:52871:58896:- [translate_table: standard]